MAELPRRYVMCRDDHPEIAEAFDALGSAAHEDKPLSRSAGVCYAPIRSRPGT